MLPSETIARYHATRAPGVNTKVLCHAPFVSLNFERSGNVTACCYNRSIVLGTYPEQSVAEMWNGVIARDFRAAFLRDAEVPGCALCFHQLQSGNFAGTLMRNFDSASALPGYLPAIEMSAPRVLEFEIANTCNLECVMCDGRWSSSIRARREQLPPLRSPYDHEFVEQVTAFLPHIAHAKFLGGEPFLIRRYYDIWERLAEINPGAQVTITTNGSFLPERARAVLEGMRAHIVVSLDAVTSPLYESIRRNARLEVVLEHVEYLADYTRRAGSGMSLAVCPMTQNWRELDRVVRFAQDRGLHLHFNTVTRPHDATLASLDPTEQEAVIRSLEAIEITGEDPCSDGNRAAVRGLQRQVEAWRDEKRAFAARTDALAAALGRRLPAAMAGRLAPGIHSLTRCMLVADELRHVSHGDLRNLLPQPPLIPWADPSPPAALDVLFATQLLHEMLGRAPDDGDGNIADRPPASRVLDLLARLESAGPDVTRHLHAAGDAMLGHLASADLGRIEESLLALDLALLRPQSPSVEHRQPTLADWHDAPIPAAAAGMDVSRMTAARTYALRSIGRRMAIPSPPGEDEPTRHELPPATPGGLRVRLDALFLQLASDALANHRAFPFNTLQLERIAARLSVEHDLIALCRDIDATEIPAAARYLEEELAKEGA